MIRSLVVGLFCLVAVSLKANDTVMANAGVTVYPVDLVFKATNNTLAYLEPESLYGVFYFNGTKFRVSENGGPFANVLNSSNSVATNLTLNGQTTIENLEVTGAFIANAGAEINGITEISGNTTIGGNLGVSGNFTNGLWLWFTNSTGSLIVSNTVTAQSYRFQTNGTFLAAAVDADNVDATILTAEELTVNPGPITFPSGAVNGYVWTSDGSGTGSWQASSGGGNFSTNANGSANFVGPITNVGGINIVGGGLTNNNWTTARLLTTTVGGSSVRAIAQDSSITSVNLLSSVSDETGSGTLVASTGSSLTNINVTGLTANGITNNGAFKHTNGAANGYVMTSDATGNATWQAPPTKFVQTNTTTVANTDVETSLTNTGVGNISIPANSLQAGNVIRITANGYFSSGSGQAFDLNLKLGSTIVCSGGLFELEGVTTNQWSLMATVVVQTNGVSGGVVASGMLSCPNHTSGISLYGGITQLVKTNTTVIDTTSAITPNLTVVWASADPANSIICQQFFFEVLKP